jgi:two-component system, response regulator, stage 0 sporulation protein F
VLDEVSCTEPALARFVKKIRVLIVEDNSDLRRLYAIGLNQRGFEVKLASNGAEAIERIEGETPHVILLDMIMPVMSGWDVINHVNNSERACPIPVVVISGQPRPEGEPLHPCITAWLEKPVSLEELVQSIGQLSVVAS